MYLSKCKDCRKFKLLTKHSETGGHQPPYIYLCRQCHDLRHDMTPPKKKYNKKVQPGTKQRRHKKQ